MSEEYKVVDEVVDAAADGYLTLSNGHIAVQEGNRVLEEVRYEGVTEKPWMRRLLDEQFDLVMLFIQSYFYFMILFLSGFLI